MIFSSNIDTLKLNKPKRKSTSVAVILAAGPGSRLRPWTLKKPKGLLRISGIVPIQRSIQMLLSAGIKEIIIGIGAHADQMAKVLAQYECISSVYNPWYENTGSMFTLYNLKNVIKDDFLLFDSDLFFEERAISSLLEYPEDNVILCSGPSYSGDEFYTEATKHNLLKKMSKCRSEMATVSGEFTGMSKVSLCLYKKLVRHFGGNISKYRDCHYEELFVVLSKTEKIYVNKIDDLLWCEVDDIVQKRQAEEVIIPKLLSLEST